MEYIRSRLIGYQKGMVAVMKNIISCGRKNAVRTDTIPQSSIPPKNTTQKANHFSNTVVHVASSRDKREKTVSALLLFGAVICTLWLCHFPDRRAASTDDDRGASALSEYEVIEVFGEFGADAPSGVNRNPSQGDGWTLSGYFKEFFSALLGV